MTENATSGNAFADNGPPAPEDSALRPAGSDLHPADVADDLSAHTARYGRESAAARAETGDDVPTPTETPAD